MRQNLKGFTLLVFAQVFISPAFRYLFWSETGGKKCAVIYGGDKPRLLISFSIGGAQSRPFPAASRRRHFQHLPILFLSLSLRFPPPPCFSRRGFHRHSLSTPGFVIKTLLYRGAFARLLPLAFSFVGLSRDSVKTRREQLVAPLVALFPSLPPPVTRKPSMRVLRSPKLPSELPSAFRAHPFASDRDKAYLATPFASFFHLFHFSRSLSHCGKSSRYHKVS